MMSVKLLDDLVDTDHLVHRAVPMEGASPYSMSNEYHTPRLWNGKLLFISSHPLHQFSFTERKLTSSTVISLLLLTVLKYSCIVRESLSLLSLFVWHVWATVYSNISLTLQRLFHLTESLHRSFFLHVSPGRR